MSLDESTRAAGGARLRVLYFLPGPGFFSGGRGGAVSHALGLVEGLAQHAQVELVASHGVTSYATGLPATVRVHPYGRGTGRLSRAGAFIEGMRTFSASLARADHAVVVVRKTLPFLLMSMFDFRLRRARRSVVVEVNGLSVEKWSGATGVRRAAFLLARYTHRLLLRSYSGVYAVSGPLKEDLVAGHSALDPRTVTVIPNGVPTPYRTTRTQQDAPASTVGLVFFGKLQPYNDFEGVTQAVAAVNAGSVSQVRLDVWGYGALSEQVRKFAEASESIEYHGAIEYAELALRLDDGVPRVGLVPLVNSKGSTYLSPIKAYDYIGLGLPVLVAGVGSVADPFVEARVGWSYDPDSPGSLKQAIRHIADLSPDEWAERLSNVRAAQSEWSWAARSQSLCQFARGVGRAGPAHRPGVM